MQLLQDIRLTVRGLRRSWRFALAFVFPLALGLGAGATFYGIIDHVLYRPPPGVADPSRIVRFAKTSRGRDPFALGNTSMAWIDYAALRREVRDLDDVAAVASRPLSLGRGERARTIQATFATASFFPLVRARPQLGRFFLPEEDEVSSTAVPCMVSDRLWRTEYGGARDVIGRSVTVGVKQCTIVGVMPRGFHGMGYTPVDVWIPLRAGAEEVFGDDARWRTDASHWLRVFGRVKPGVSLAALSDEATRAYRTVSGRQRDPELRERMAAQPLLGVAAGSSTRIRLARWLVGGAAVLVALVVANLLNLLVARNLGRTREMGIRRALGGGRWHLFRLALLECAVLAGLAGATSLLVVRWTGPVARAALFPGLEWAAGPVTGRVVALAIAASVVLGAAVAAITTMSATRVDPMTLLNAGGGARIAGGRGSRRVRFLLVGTQAALSLVLLMSAAGFVRSFREAAGTDLGFAIDGLIQAEVQELPGDTSVANRLAFYQRLHDRVRSLPGVASASLGFTGPWWTNRFGVIAIPGRDSLPEVPNFGTPAFDAVTPEYLATMRLRLKTGRWITEADGPGAPPVLVVNAALAQFYWPGEPNVLGYCLRVGEGSPVCREIVGVVANHRFTGGLDDPPIPAYFLPLAQAGTYRVFPKLFVRARADAAELLPTIRGLVQGFESGLPAASVTLVKSRLDPLLASWRLGAMAFTALGAVAAIIAALGLFSVLAYLVAEQRREFAIRGALGAQASQILRPVVRQGVTVVAIGTIVGMLIVSLGTRWVQPLLFHVRLLDPVVLGIVVAVLLAAAVLAALGPARQASRLDPMDVLRAE